MVLEHVLGISGISVDSEVPASAQHGFMKPSTPHTGP